MIELKSQLQEDIAENSPDGSLTETRQEGHSGKEISDTLEEVIGNVDRPMDALSVVTIRENNGVINIYNGPGGREKSPPQEGNSEESSDANLERNRAQETLTFLIKYHQGKAKAQYDDGEWANLDATKRNSLMRSAENKAYSEFVTQAGYRHDAEVLRNMGDDRVGAEFDKKEKPKVPRGAKKTTPTGTPTQTSSVPLEDDTDSTPQTAPPNTASSEGNETPFSAPVTPGSTEPASKGTYDSPEIDEAAEREAQLQEAQARLKALKEKEDAGEPLTDDEVAELDKLKETILGESAKDPEEKDEEELPPPLPIDGLDQAIAAGDIPAGVEAAKEASPEKIKEAMNAIKEKIWNKKNGQILLVLLLMYVALELFLLTKISGALKK